MPSDLDRTLVEFQQLLRARDQVPATKMGCGGKDLLGMASRSLVARQVFQHRVASGFGLVEIFKGRAGDPDRATAFINRTPRRQITGAS